MRLVLLLVVVTAIGLSAARALKTAAPGVPEVAGTPGLPRPPESAADLKRFEQDVGRLVEDAAADRARQMEEASH